MQKRKADPIFFVAMALPVVLFLVMCFRIGPGTSGNQLFELPSVVQIQGEYCADGGQWLALSQEHPFVNKNYETVVFRGQLSAEIPEGQYLILTMRNLWVELRVDGTTVATNLVRPDGTQAQTPGYSIAYAPASSIPKGSSVELSLRNPYRAYQADSYTKFMEHLYVGTRDMLYTKMIVEEGGSMALSLVLCGLIPVLLLSSGVIRKTEPYRFAALSSGRPQHSTVYSQGTDLSVSATLHLKPAAVYGFGFVHGAFVHHHVRLLCIYFFKQAVEPMLYGCGIGIGHCRLHPVYLLAPMGRFGHLSRSNAAVSGHCAVLHRRHVLPVCGSETVEQQKC